MVGVRLIPHEQLHQHMVHAVERYRQDERKRKEKDNDIQRKLAQLQKVKSQALLTPGATEQVLPPSTATNFAPYTPGVITQPPYTQRSGGQVPYRPRRGSKRGPPGGRRPMRACWACGELGHFADRCPIAQGNPNVQHDCGQSRQGGARGLADPWVSPNFGF